MDGTLQTLFGTLKVDVSPAVPGVRLRLKRQGDAQDREIHESTLSLQDGLYTITASAAKYQDAAVTVRVTPGNSATATIAMKKVEPSLSVKLAPVQDNPAPPPFLLNDWLKGGGWTRDGVSIKRQGGDFIIAPPVLAAGTIQFTILSIHGRRVEWVAGFRDTKNYYLYQFEDSSFTRTEVADGKHSKAVKVQISARHDHPNAFLIQITPKSIIHSVPQGPNWKLLDSWSPEGGVVAGKFGFRVPGRDEISLSDFKLTQN